MMGFGVFFSPQLSAIEHITTHSDGTRLFSCKMRGTVYRMKVRKSGHGKYNVYVLSKGRSGFSGVVHANNFEAAARVGCGRG